MAVRFTTVRFTAVRLKAAIHIAAFNEWLSRDV